MSILIIMLILLILLIPNFLSFFALIWLLANYVIFICISLDFWRGKELSFFSYKAHTPFINFSCIIKYLRLIFSSDSVLRLFLFLFLFLSFLFFIHRWFYFTFWSHSIPFIITFNSSATTLRKAIFHGESDFLLSFKYYLPLFSFSFSFSILHFLVSLWSFIFPFFAVFLIFL